MNVGRKKILFCIQDLRGRGAERVLATLLKYFDREKYQQYVFVYHDDFAIKIPEHVDILSAHLKYYPPQAGLFRKIGSNFRKVASLCHAIGTIRPDIALSVSGTNIALMLAKPFCDKKLQIILSEHTFPSLFNKETENIFARYVTNTFISLMYPRADRVVTPSKAVANDLVMTYRVPASKISVIPNPLDIEHIRRSAMENPNFAFPDDDSLRVGFIGGLSKEKNIPCLMRALAKTTMNGRKTRLFLVGEGEERKALESLSVQLSVAERVHFLGFRENPYAVLRHFDVLVVPSLFETFSYVILEAMACGVPVISSKWKGCEDIYSDMENCLLVPVDDEKELAAAIERIMLDENLRGKLVRKGYGLAEKCDAKEIVTEYDNAIREVLAGNHPA